MRSNVPHLLLPMLLPMLLAAACTDPGANDSAMPEAKPIVYGQEGSATVVSQAVDVAPAQPLAPANQTELRIAPDAVGAGPATPAPQDLLPLASILGIVQKQVSGEIIDVDHHDDDGLMVYEVEVLTAAGRKIEIKIDARHGTVLELEED